VWVSDNGSASTICLTLVERGRNVRMYRMTDQVVKAARDVESWGNTVPLKPQSVKGSLNPTSQPSFLCCRPSRQVMLLIMTGDHQSDSRNDGIQALRQIMPLYKNPNLHLHHPYLSSLLLRLLLLFLPSRLKLRSLPRADRPRQTRHFSDQG